MRIYDKSNLKIIREFKGHTWLINDVIILNSDRSNKNQTHFNNQQQISEYDQLISCSSDTIIKIWNVNDQVVLQNIKSHYLEVTSLVLFDENNLISAGKDSLIFFYEITYSQNNNMQQPFIIDEKDPQDMQLEKQEQISRIKKMITKITQVYELKYLEFPIKQIEKINEIFFVAGYMNGVIALANFEQKQFLYCFEDKHDLGLYCLAKLDESTFCSSGGDSKVKVWNLTQSHSISEYQFTQQEYINRIKVLRKNKYIAVSHSNQIDLLSYSSQIDDKQIGNQQKKSTKIPSFAQKNNLLKVLQVKLKNPNEVSDFYFDQIKSNEENYQQVIVIGVNQPKILYFS
ncbi:WD domain, G-beta repeat protein (macronuclear) [Tetrahymena thermophila SB210]|uniref:WD domain, G-beta repeat protein n=1 Tax=Tetrahymena thermophila (strain SB210) TaxID=312017 RepID=Q24CM7_TETTS|nr:WD domain, G-beta repeat protein [Tetrahymena thermophila SB210]EAS05537.2 WD domain, G-beta repeat protein [Tetrahymena thermophila SB210]|eukprot:XP_001025782.2 WD domain, G-beta repeat protein [Tetrahymena thermophila SB210]